ncbi:MAG: hypothetical protein Fur0041_23120 [Bacteroidia bacterium]
MRVALLTDGIHPHVVGGMQRHSYYLAKFLAANGVQVDLYHTIPGKTAETDSLPGFTQEEKNNCRSIVIPFPKMGDFPGHYIRESYEYSRKIAEKLQQETLPDFIYAKGFTAWELVNLKSKGMSLPPVGINFHGYEMFQKQPDFISSLKSKIFFKAPVLFNIRNADYVFSYGGKITSIIKSLGIPSGKIIEHPTGISADWIKSDALNTHDGLRFVFVGRDERRKGIHELLSVIEKLPVNGNWEFHFIGKFSKKAKGKHIIYHGEIKDNAVMRSKLDQCDVLVCPSHSEGMPNVIIEAMSRGLAILATDVGAVSVAVNESNGWLIAPGDSSMLMKSLRQILNADYADILSKREASRKMVSDRFLWNTIALDTIASIKKCIGHEA